MEWTCPKCATRNPGSEQSCISCGAPQPENVQFEQAQRQELVTDAEKIEAAKGGPDIHCPYCGTRNPAGAPVCKQCGGDLSEGALRVSGRVVGAYKEASEPEKQLPCPNCASLNPETGLKCTNCGATLRAQPASAAQPPPAAQKKSNPALKWLGIGAIALLIVACIVYFAINLTRRDNLTASVEGVEWMRVVPIMALVDVTHSAFIDDIPADAQMGVCERQYHHTQDTPEGDSVEVCGTPYTKDTGSGYAEVVQDCQYEVYMQHCEYTAQEMQQVDQVQASGSDLAPVWPQVILDSGEQEGEREQKFTVVFLTKDGELTYTTSDEVDFSRFAPGTEWTLVLNGFGNIVSLEPK